jgi:16S rRNA (cytosine1402-N4)-methyltransferase
MSKWIKSAARVFQAIRIEVNKELDNLKKFLSIFPEYLVPGSRLAVISYHSLEDRLVKDYFKKYSGICICPKELPVCSCDSKKVINIITKKPVLPDDKEIKRNPRSRSAKLRIAERTEV